MKGTDIVHSAKADNSKKFGSSCFLLR
jgi:hypothetical protein